MRTATCFAALVLAAHSVSAAQNWPQWRGPLANGLAPDANPPIEWGEGKNVKWKIALPGSGTSTPIIWGDKIYVTTAINTGKKPGGTASLPAVSTPQVFAQQAPPPPPPGAPKGPPPGGKRGPGGFGGFGGGQAPSDIHDFVLLCLDRATGKPLWQKTLRSSVPHEGHHRDHGFASHSPVTDGEHLYVSFGSRGLFCVDMTGNVKWEKDLGDMRTRNGFGEGSSPALHGDTLVINWDHEGDDFIVALDKRTGKELWRKPRQEITSWSTPFIIEHGGKAQVIVNATGRVRSYDLASGEILWESGGQTDNAIPTPVAGHGRVYVTSGFRGSALHAIKLGQSGDLTDKPDAYAWKHASGTPYVPSPLLYGDRLYFLKGNDAMISAFNAKDGKPLYTEQRLEGLRGVYASITGAAGRVYIVGRDGGAVVLKDSDKLEILATNKLDDPIDASPVMVGNELFLRGKQHLYCLATR
jgi:outer membrane protein assembly factor BamB